MSKTSKTPRVQVSSLSDFDVTLPKYYDEMTDDQLLTVYKELAKGDQTLTTIRVKCFEKLSGIVLHRVNDIDNTLFFWWKGNKYLVSLETIITAAKANLSYIGEVPAAPVRIKNILGHKAIDANLIELSFGDFLILENCYQSYLASQEERFLQQMARILYPGLGIDIGNALLFNITNWYISVKIMFANKWKHLFAKSEEDDDDEPEINPEKNMNDMLWALTDGHPEREEAIKALGTWRALEALDRKAILAAEYKSKK